MANHEHVALLREGVGEWNRWRKKNPDITPDLTRTSFIRTNLSHANLTRVDLTDTNLSESNLSWAILSGANLSGATLALTNFYRANLRGANLSGAYLCHANITETNLAGAMLAGAILGETVLANLDLTEVQDLERCFHHLRSFVDYGILLCSKNLPEKFLRGCGLPDSLINYLPSLLNEAPQSCFISYSHQDEDFAQRLHDDLQNKGVRCWFAPHDVRSGRKLHEQIEDAIRIHDRLLLILSVHSMQSEWVRTEIANARQEEIRDGRRVLFPIRLVDFETLRTWTCFDADTGKDSAREIREYFIPDFSNWKDPDAYQEVFERLLRDLKAGEEREDKKGAA